MFNWLIMVQLITDKLKTVTKSSNHSDKSKGDGEKRKSRDLTRKHLKQPKSETGIPITLHYSAKTLEHNLQNFILWKINENVNIIKCDYNRFYSQLFSFSPTLYWRHEYNKCIFSAVPETEMCHEIVEKKKRSKTPSRIGQIKRSLTGI